MQRVPCSDKVEVILWPCGRKKSNSFLLVWEWNPALLAAGRAGSSHSRRLCSPEHCAKWCPGSKHVWGKRQRLLFASRAWQSRLCCTAPGCLTHCALGTGSTVPSASEEGWEGTFQGHHLCLHCSPQAQRAAEGMGEPLPPTRLLQRSSWPSSAVKKKTQQVLVVHSIAGHAGRCVFIKNQCSNQVSGEQTKPCQVSGSAPPLLTLNSVPGFPLLLSSYQAGKSTLTISTFSL